MHAILRVDHKARIGFGLGIGIDDLIDTRRAIKPRRFAIERQIAINRHGGISELQMRRLIFLMVRRRDEHR